MRQHQDIERVERVGADVTFGEGVASESSFKWHFSALGFFQWVTGIAMLVMMVMVKNDVEALHSALHGGDEEAIHFNVLKTDVSNIYGVSLTAVDTGGAAVVGLPHVLAHINGLLHANGAKVAALTRLTSHMNDAESTLQVDLAAFVEHHAEDVECTDCRENLAAALASRADDDLHDCGVHYCLALATPLFDSASACVDPAATNPSIHQDATCYDFNTSTACTDAAYVAGAFTPLEFGYTGLVADCPSTGNSTCVFTAGTACGDHSPTVDAATGVGTCAAAFDSGAPTSAQECTVTGYKLYDAAECAAASLYPTSNDTAAAETPCHAKCDGYNFADDTGCFNTTAGTTGDVQFEDFLEASCIAATGAASGTASLFGEDHYRSHSLCAAADLAEATAGTATAAALITKQAASGARAACELLDFCRA